HRLIVEEVESLHTDLQAMSFAPGHLERFVYTRVHVSEADISEHISFASLTRSGIAETLEGFCCIATEDRSSTYWTSLNGSGSCGIALHIPVGRPASVIEGSSKGKTGVIADNAGHLPAAQQAIRYSATIAE